ncbi:membrane protein [Beggiatoa sp. PS]|nr:membrane protein [Beggiatoa sp. PS]
MAKSLIWAISTLFFGLLPLWFVLFNDNLQNKNQIFLFEQFITTTSGVLLFFVTAIVASITIEYFLLSKANQKISKGWVFPMVLIIFCAWLYEKTMEDINLENLFTIEINVLLIVFFYAIDIKFFAFKIISLQKFSTTSNASQWLVFLKTSWKSVIWAIMTYFFGLLPFWLVYLFMPSNSFNFAKFVIDGPLLLFATTLVSSITIEYLLSIKTTKWYEVFLFVIFPFLILIYCVALFYIPDGKEIDIELLYSTQQGILIVTFIYSIVVKYHAFK